MSQENYVNEYPDKPPEWHAKEVARLMRKQGFCVFWSVTLEEQIAFIKDGTYRDAIPEGVVAYTKAELKEMFGEGQPLLTKEGLRLIHEAKKYEGQVLRSDFKVT